MNIDRVILQVKQYCPIFNGNVAGSANYAEGLETVVSLPLPACYVYPLDDEIDESSGMGGSLYQRVRERIAVVVVLDNSTDRRGQAAATSVEDVKYALFAGALNFNPSGLPRAAQGLRYAGGHLLGMDRSRLFWELHFDLVSTITQTDGFIPNAEYLETITIHDTDHPPLVIGIQVDNQMTGLASISFTA